MATIPVRLSNETDSQYIARLTAELSRAKTKTDDGLKVSEKGAISVYGHGRFPVTLYFEQWKALLMKQGGMSEDQFNASPIGQFGERNRSSLKTKADTEKASA